MQLRESERVLLNASRLAFLLPSSDMSLLMFARFHRRYVSSLSCPLVISSEMIKTRVAPSVST